jgi:hypothetical protein
MTEHTKKEIMDFLGKVPTSVPVSRVLEIFDLNEKNFGVNPQYIVDKYRVYLKWWRATYGSRDQQYLSKEEKKVDIYIFSSSKMYENTLKVEMSERDHYIFGDEYDMEDVESALKNLLKKLKLKIR